MNNNEDVNDIFDNLKTPADIAIYLKEALEHRDAAFASAAIGNVTRFIGMAKISDKTGFSREGLYRIFSDKGDPRLSTLMSVLASIGLKISVELL